MVLCNKSALSIPKYCRNIRSLWTERNTYNNAKPSLERNKSLANDNIIFPIILYNGVFCTRHRKCRNRIVISSSSLASNRIYNFRNCEHPCRSYIIIVFGFCIALRRMGTREMQQYTRFPKIWIFHWLAYRIMEGVPRSPSPLPLVLLPSRFHTHT